MDAVVEDLDKFYEMVDKVYEQCKSSDIKIVMGDMNAKEHFVDWCVRNRHQYLVQATSQTTLYLDKPWRQST